MSAKWMGYFFDDTDLEGSELLLALAIADHADMDGKCNPGVALLSKKIRLKERQTQVLMKRLEAKGYVQIARSKGRGNLTHFQLKRVHSSTPFEENKRCIPAQIKGAFSQQEKVHSGALPIYKEEPLIEPSIKPEEEENTSSANASRLTVDEAAEYLEAETQETEEPESEAEQIYREFYPAIYLSPDQKKLLAAEQINAELWRRTLRMWKGNNSKASNIGNLINRYEQEFSRTNKTPGTQKKNQWSKEDYASYYRKQFATVGN